MFIGKFQYKEINGHTEPIHHFILSTLCDHICNSCKKLSSMLQRWTFTHRSHSSTVTESLQPASNVVLSCTTTFPL